MKLKPAANNITVELRDAPRDENDKSVIQLPEGVRLYPHGLVLDVGPEVTNCKIDDKVIFMPQNLMGFADDRGNVYILPSTAVLGYYVD